MDDPFAHRKNLITIRHHSCIFLIYIICHYNIKKEDKREDKADNKLLIKEEAKKDSSYCLLFFFAFLI